MASKTLVPRGLSRIQAARDVSDPLCWGRHRQPSWYRRPRLLSHGKCPVYNCKRLLERRVRVGSTHRFSGETLAKDFGVLVDEQVLDGIGIAFSSC